MAEDNKYTFPTDEQLQERYEAELKHQNELLRTQAALEAITDETEKQIFLSKQLLEAKEKITAAELRDIDARLEKGEITKAQHAEFVRQFEKITTSQKLRIEQLEKQKQAAEDILGSLMNIAGIKAGTGSSIFKFFENLKTAGVDGLKNMVTMENVAQGLVNVGAQIGELVLEPTIELAYAQDKAISQLKRATAAGDIYSDILIDSEINMRTFGVSMDQVAGSIEELHTQTSLFTEMSEKSKMVVTENTAMMAQFGVSAGTTAANLDILTKAMGMNAQQATYTNRELYATAQAIGVTPEVIMNDFGPAMSTLAAHGDRAVRVFKDMSAAAKATGVEMNTLLGYAKNFDTFEGAAQSVGKLNALLGGPYLNSIEMLNASEEERIRMMIESIELSGRSFSEMGKYEQMAIANAAGITDMAEANKLFNTSLSAYDALQVKSNAAAISLEEFEEASRDAMEIADKGKAILRGFAVSMRPLVSFVSWLADGVLWLQEVMGDWFGRIVGITAVLLVGLGVLFKVAIAVASLASTVMSLGGASAATTISITAQNGATVNLAGANHTAAASNGTLTTSTRAAGAAAKFSAKSIAALGFAVMMIGAGVGAAAFGVAALAYSFSLMDAGQILASAVAIQVFMAGMLAMLIVLAALVAGPQAALTGAAIGVLFAIGGAMLLIGGAVFIAASGIALAAAGFGYMFSELSRAPEMMIYLGALVAIMGVFGVMAVILVPGMVAMAGAFAALGASIKTMMDDIELEKLVALATVMESLRDIMHGPQSGGTTASPPAGGGTPGSPFTSMISAVNSLSGEKVDQASRLASVASSYNAGSGGASTAPTYMVLDGIVFAKLVKKYGAKGIPLKQKMV